MSHQAARPSPDGPIFKEPNNLDVIYVPSDQEILSSPDIRCCQFAVIVPENNLPGVLAEDKDYTVQFFGSIQDIMENDESLKPEPFRDFVGKIVQRINLNVVHNSISIYVATGLNVPALCIRTHREFANFFVQFADLFRRDPLSNSVLYFFVVFDAYLGVVSESTPQHAPIPHRPYAPPPFLRDQEVDHYVAAGGMSPQHITPTGYEPTGYEPTGYEPTGYEPTGYEPTGYEPTGYEPTGSRPNGSAPDGSAPNGSAPNGSRPSRKPVTPPHGSPSQEDTPIPQPAPPQRVKTMVAASKAVSKLVIAVKNAPGTVKDLVSPRAHQEQTTVLTELATRIDQDDYLTSLLPKTNGMPEHQTVIDKYQIEQFERFSRWFPDIDPKQRENTRSIRFPQTELAVTPHQFTRAMEILFQSHATGGLLNGGILASDMGTGKGVICLSSVLIRALIFESERRVMREWAEVDSREQSLKKGVNIRPIHLDHLPRHAPGGKGLKCPTQSLRPWGVHCFCCPDGPTRKEISSLKRGPALIQVPSASMPGWIETLENVKPSRMAYNFQVLSAATGLSSRLQPSPNFVKGFAGSKMGAVLPEGHPGGFVDRPQDLTWIVQPAPPSNRSVMAMETYIVVTCHNSPQLRDLFSWHVSDLSPAPQNAQFPHQGLPAFCVGLNLIDEAHKVLEGDRMPLFMAGVNRKVLPTPQTTTVGDIWLVSGTPFGGKLEDLMTAVSYFAPHRTGEATALLQAYEEIQPAMTNAPRAEFEALFSNVFGGRLTLRDDKDTTFMGSRITDLQNVRPQYISRETPQSQLHSVRMLLCTKAVTVAPDGYFDMMKRMKQNTQLLYLLSMFPSAAKVLLESPATAFTDLDTRRMIRKEKNTTGESLTANKTFRALAEKISRSPRSPKLAFILEELDRMDKDREPRPQASKSAASAHIQDDPTLKKMVIITPTVFTAVLLYIILARYHSKSGPLLYHQDLKQSQRGEVLRRFNSLRKRDGPWRVLIAPASVASEALNLQIANRLILTSPLLDPHQESQALARVNRIGQPFDVQLKILLLEDSPVDRIVIAHRANATLQSNPFNVEEDVKVISSDDDSGSTLVG